MSDRALAGFYLLMLSIFGSMVGVVAENNSRAMVFNSIEASNRYAYRHFNIIRSQLPRDRRWSEDLIRDSVDNLHLAAHAAALRDRAACRDFFFDLSQILIGSSAAMLGAYGVFGLSFLVTISVASGTAGIIWGVLAIATFWQDIRGADEIARDGRTGSDGIPAPAARAQTDKAHYASAGRVALCKGASA